jgi:hypothetical protein
MCQLCGNQFNCAYNQLNQLRGLSVQSMLSGLGVSQPQNLIPQPKMTIEDVPFIIMQVGCNNLLGVYSSKDEALRAAEKLCKKQILKLHIFELHSTIESENKVEITSKKV